MQLFWGETKSVCVCPCACKISLLESEKMKMIRFVITMIFIMQKHMSVQKTGQKGNNSVEVSLPLISKAFEQWFSFSH